MSKDDKYIIVYSIAIGFLLTMFGPLGFIMLFGPRVMVNPEPVDMVIIVLAGVVGLGVCISGLYSRLH